jgi:hypothetical protein
VELQEFISTTLQQIVNGVQDAQVKLLDNEAYGFSNPVGPVSEGRTKNWEDSLKFRTQVVHFDVAVSTSDTAGTEGGGGIKVLSFFSADGRISKEAETAFASRITFDVPTALPPMKYRDPKPKPEA